MSGEIQYKAREWLNSQLKKEVKNLEKCHEIYKEWFEKKCTLENSLASVSNEVPSKVFEAGNNIEEACSSILKTLNEVEEMLNKIKELTSSNDEIYCKIKDYFNNINHLEQFLSYLQILKYVPDISDSLQTHATNQDFNLTIFLYKQLCETSLSLINSKCHHLKTFLIETTRYWNGILKDMISADFATAMKNMNWPIVNTNLALPNPSKDAVIRFQRGVKQLLKIQLPIELENVPVVSSSLQVTFPSLTLPMIVLIQPLKKRFVYHFSGPRRTNRLDKPEWYFTQILTWIREHESFVINWVQPIYDNMKVDKSPLVELMCGLVELSVEKLERDMDDIQYDDALFSHIVDELLGYERELRQIHLYPSSLPGPLHVLTQAQLFVKWIKMEKKFAREKMDSIMSSETAWTSLSCSDDEKITEVAHTFLALLSTMTDRYSLLPQPGHRLQFVELELELIDDLRLSLLQILRFERTDPINSKVASVLNTVFHLKTALEQYDVSPTVLLLQHYKSQFATNSKEKEEGLFQPSITLLERLESQLLEELSSSVLMEMKARSRPYRKYRWFTFTMEEFDATSITQEACPMFQALADNLHKLHGSLSEKLFSRLWKLIATQLHTFLLEEVLLDNTFSVAGARTLEKDITKFLLPLFQQYTLSPNIYFQPFLEACMLLSLPELAPTIRRAVLTEDMQEIKEGLNLNIKNLTLHQISVILGLRIDVATAFM